MVMLAKVASMLLIASVPEQVHANAFLGHHGEQTRSERASATFEHELLGELESVLGSEHRTFTERRLSKIENVVRPIYQAMPKTLEGKLGHEAVSYVLHRIFVHLHGWVINGLEPGAKGDAAWNQTSPVSLLTDKVPEYVQTTFEQRIGESGMNTREIAVLAATLEHLVHKEAVARLKLAYKVHEFSPEEVVPAGTEALGILDTYMAVYILGFMSKSSLELDPEEVRELRDNVHMIYPTWPDTQQFIREVQQSVLPNRDYFYFSEAVTVIEEAGERYGRWQDLECRVLKETLLAVEDTGPGGAGRVRVADFYKLALHDGKWQFSESTSHLRTLGALDESDPKNPRVIVANYVNGPSNCISSSSYFSVCCINECEGLFAHLEQTLAKPHAYPAVIAALVGSLQSATQQNDRKLSPWLLQQLDEVAAYHGGLVPLHGRLFSQWMHFAYPRECPYPHVSGSVNAVFLSEVIESGAEATAQVTANETTMRYHLDSVPTRVEEILDPSAHEELTMLSMEEELVVWRTPTQANATNSMSMSLVLRGLAFLGAVAVTAAGFAKSFGAYTHENHCEQGAEKYFV